MNKKLEVAVIILSVFTLIISVAALTLALKKSPTDGGSGTSEVVTTAPADGEDADKDAVTTAPADANDAKDVQYVLYLGTNDKDTNEPVFEPAKAKEKAEEILLDHFGGYTIQEANGGWKDGDKVYNEYTLVIYLSDTDIDQVHAACKEMIKTFNQSSVLIQANETTTEFYDGK